MKRIIVFMIIILTCIGLISGCLSGREAGSTSAPADSTCGHAVHTQVAESIIIYGFVFLSGSRGVAGAV